MPLLVGLTFEAPRGFAVTLGYLGFAEHVGGLGRLALAARRPLVPAGGALMRSALSVVLILLFLAHRGAAYPTQAPASASDPPPPAPAAPAPAAGSVLL